MGWSGTLTAQSAVGNSIVLTPDTTTEGGYTVSAFTAPKKGVYQFIMSGSGGTIGYNDAGDGGSAGSSPVAGGTGGVTIGFLLLERGQTVYCGCGGTCSAAFVSSANGNKLSAINAGSLFFVAGGGGAAGKAYKTNYAYVAGKGGNGGGASGTAGGDASWGGSTATGGTAGTRTAGGTGGNGGGYGYGGASLYQQVEYQPCYAWSGRGGDGLYGGGSGKNIVSHNSGTGYRQSHSAGGGGGSGYVHTSTLKVLSKTYSNSTSQGGGASSNSGGSVKVVYYARAELPVVFNGTRLERLFFNGTEVGSLIFNGTKLFFERIKRSVSAWFMSIRTETGSRIPI